MTGTGNKHWATAKDACMLIEKSKDGIASAEPRTLIELFAIASKVPNNWP